MMMVATAAGESSTQAKNVCLDCHGTMEPPLQVTAEKFAADVHAAKGLNCTSCHGGDPQNEDRAMTPAAGFRGKIRREQIPQLCGSCHSDTARMRQYNPSLRTDQLVQYRSSVHGKKLSKGDTRVAVCTDCHSVHDIRPSSDTRSTVHPTNVANTCKRCHSDREYMKPYGIPTDQYAGYTTSVHYDAMVVRGDLSAPTCTTCHGNHGAAPPGVASVANVCSTCHVFQAQQFEMSPHKAVFGNAGLPACVTCHSNHRIQHPDDNMIGLGTTSVCRNCHSEGDKGADVASTIHSQLSDLQRQIAQSKQVLDRAAQSGMEVGEANLELSQGVDALMKARVLVHSASAEKVKQETAAGTKLAEKTYKAGMDALRERDYRRKGLGLSLIAVFAVVIGLAFYIREVEGR